MDKSGKSIGLSTAISDLTLDVDQILNLIVIDQINGDSLNDALKKLEISFTGDSDD